jgi:hypothetical protein
MENPSSAIYDAHEIKASGPPAERALMKKFTIAAFVSLILLSAGSVRAQNLLANPDFESGLAGWTTWVAPVNGFWTGNWIHSNDCDIWIPPSSCPLGGAGISHAQKKGNGAGNAHGGLYQVVAVVPGQHYRVSGYWSGGVTGNVNNNNGTWWEVTVYDGAVADAVIDQAPGPNDQQIAKIEANNLATNGVYQFDWQPFSGTFTARSNTVTLALKTGSFFTFEAAGYHDNLSLALVEPVPAVGGPGLIMLALLIGAIGIVKLGAGRARRV